MAGPGRFLRVEHTENADEAVWQETLDNGASIAVTIRRTGDGPLVVTRVEIDARPSGVVDATTLRSIRLAEIAANAGREIDRQLRAGGTVAQILAAHGRRLGLPVEKRTDDYRPGRGGRGDLFYARAALRYIELVENGTMDPTFALGQRLAPDKSNYYEWARYALKQAKTRGLYVPHGRGRRGGKLTPKALRLLEADHGRPA